MPNMKCQPRQLTTGPEGMFCVWPLQPARLWERASFPRGEERPRKMAITKTSSPVVRPAVYDPGPGAGGSVCAHTWHVIAPPRGLGGGLSTHLAGDSHPSPGVQGARKDGPGINPGHCLPRVSSLLGCSWTGWLTNPQSDPEDAGQPTVPSLA